MRSQPPTSDTKPTASATRIAIGSLASRTWRRLYAHRTTSSVVEKAKATMPSAMSQPSTSPTTLVGLTSSG